MKEFQKATKIGTGEMNLTPSSLTNFLWSIVPNKPGVHESYFWKDSESTVDIWILHFMVPRLPTGNPTRPLMGVLHQTEAPIYESDMHVQIKSSREATDMQKILDSGTVWSVD